MGTSSTYYGCLMLLWTIFCFIVLVHSQQINMDVYKSELFVKKISPDLISWNDTERIHDFRYIVTSVESPDLPPWIFTTKTNESSIFIYGVPPIDLDINILELPISITSLYSYRTKYCKIIMSILPREKYAKHEIRLRISNVNIQEMLLDVRLNEFRDIFENHFWPESKNELYITHLTQSENEGFRLPVNPNDTSGVIIHLGCAANFSMQLYDIQNETKPLSKHCPSSFSKRITVELFFRPKEFVIDWCYFKLIELDDNIFTSTLKCSTGKQCVANILNDTALLLSHDEEILVDKEKVPVSPIFRMLVLLVIIPSVILSLVITVWLASFMCLHNSKLYDPYSDDYFETIFFICEDFKRAKHVNEEQAGLENDEYNANEALFHF